MSTPTLRRTRSSNSRAKPGAVVNAADDETKKEAKAAKKMAADDRKRAEGVKQKQHAEEVGALEDEMARKDHTGRREAARPVNREIIRSSAGTRKAAFIDSDEHAPMDVDGSNGDDSLDFEASAEQGSDEDAIQEVLPATAQGGKKKKVLKPAKGQGEMRSAIRDARAVNERMGSTEMVSLIPNKRKGDLDAEAAAPALKKGKSAILGGFNARWIPPPATSPKPKAVPKPTLQSQKTRAPYDFNMSGRRPPVRLMTSGHTRTISTTSNNSTSSTTSAQPSESSDLEVDGPVSYGGFQDNDEEEVEYQSSTQLSVYRKQDKIDIEEESDSDCAELIVRPVIKKTQTMPTKMSVNTIVKPKTIAWVKKMSVIKIEKNQAETSERQTNMGTIKIEEMGKVGNRLPPTGRVLEAKKVPYTTDDLPLGCKKLWARLFVPAFRDLAGAFDDPWDPSMGGIDLLGEIQTLFNWLWADISHTVAYRHDPVYFVLKQRFYDWRTAFGTAAVTAVKKLFTDNPLYPDAPSRAQYVQTAIGDGMPFVFVDPVTRSGAWQTSLILETFASHLIATGSVPTKYKTTKMPRGALVLSVVGVERALSMYASGTISDDSRGARADQFSESNWGSKTRAYADSIASIKGGTWKKILAGATCIVESRKGQSSRLVVEDEMEHTDKRAVLVDMGDDSD